MTSNLDLPNIVLIGGTGCGKSTAADLLHELGYVRFGFAGRADDPHLNSPRDLVRRIWGPDAINDREKLIALANGCRSVDPDVWLHALEAQLVVEGVPVVVDDCRFENEYYGLKGRGFVSVRITAPMSHRIDRLRINGKYTSEEYFDHPIEHYLDHIDADYSIENDGSRDDLYDDLVDVLMRERRRR